MLQVGFTGSLRSALKGEKVIHIEANTIAELMDKLVEIFPDLGQHIDSGIAVAIDGQIYRDNWDVEIAMGSEVFLLPRIQGG